MRKLKNSELERLAVEEFKEAKKTPLIVILDNIRSLNNIGSVFRTSDAFLIEKIYLCGITAKPPHRDIHKTALGATDSVEWEHVEDTIELIKKLQEDYQQLEHQKSLLQHRVNIQEQTNEEMEAELDKLAKMLRENS